MYVCGGGEQIQAIQLIHQLLIVSSVNTNTTAGERVAERVYITQCRERKRADYVEGERRRPTETGISTYFPVGDRLDHTAYSLRLNFYLIFPHFGQGCFLKKSTKMWMLQVLCVSLCIHAVQARIWAWMLSIPYSASEDGPVGPRDREAEIFPSNPKGDMVSYSKSLKKLSKH